MNIRRLRKGMVLLHTLVMAVLLSMLAVMVLKWIMGRYMMAARGYRSVTTTAHTQGYISERMSSWNSSLSSIVSSDGTTIDGKNVSYVTSGPASMRTIILTSDEDQ